MVLCGLVLDQQQTMHFVKILSNLSKCGQYVSLFIHDRLVLTTVDDQKTLYCKIELEPSLMMHMEQHAEGIKILIKPLLNALRNTDVIEKCTIGVQEDLLIVSLECIHDVRKQHQFTFEEAEYVEANYPEQLTNKASVNPKSISAVLSHVSSRQWDIELVASPHSCLWSTLTSEDALSTTVNMDVMEFQSWDVQSRSRVVLNLKHFKSSLFLGESREMIVNLNFDHGSPFVVDFVSDKTHGLFVLANMDGSEPPLPTQSQEIPGSPTRPSKSVFDELLPTTPKVKRTRTDMYLYSQ
ncbi:Rad9-domain-containing protein [Gorgonomyces haynaldii]|nr:Rad9-domain-containing protein [Gorgonomyces haynaldii]